MIGEGYGTDHGRALHIVFRSKRPLPRLGHFSPPKPDQGLGSGVRSGRRETEVLARHCRADDPAMMLPHGLGRQGEHRLGKDGREYRNGVPGPVDLRAPREKVLCLGIIRQADEPVYQLDALCPPVSTGGERGLTSG